MSNFEQCGMISDKEIDRLFEEAQHRLEEWMKIYEKCEYRRTPDQISIPVSADLCDHPDNRYHVCDPEDCPRVKLSEKERTA